MKLVDISKLEWALYIWTPMYEMGKLEIDYEKDHEATPSEAVQRYDEWEQWHAMKQEQARIDK